MNDPATRLAPTSSVTARSPSATTGKPSFVNVFQIPETRMDLVTSAPENPHDEYIA